MGTIVVLKGSIQGCTSHTTARYNMDFEGQVTSHTSAGAYSHTHTSHIGTYHDLHICLLCTVLRWARYHSGFIDKGSLVIHMYACT